MAAAQFVMVIVNAVIGLILGAFLLWLATKISKPSDATFKTAFFCNAILIVIQLVFGLINAFLGAASLTGIMIISGISFLVQLVASIVLVKSFYKEAWGKTMLTWVLWLVFTLIVGFIVGLILVAVFAVFGINPMA